MTVSAAKFEVGQVVHHLKFGYRGVVFDVDPCFQGTEGWYEQVARSRPPKDKPGITSWFTMRHTPPTSPSGTWSRTRRADLSSTGCWTSCSAALRTALPHRAIHQLRPHEIMLRCSDRFP